MRLTYKYEDCSGYGSIKVKNLPPDPLVNKLPYLDNIWEKERNKLGQLEDIEDELGIDLITLFKALKQGYIYYPINCPNDCYKYKIECLYMKPRIHLYVADGVGGCYMEDYGKTWALTKEELL